MGTFRFLLALCVVLFHSGFGGGAGPIAVSVFYLMSGYLISLSLFNVYLVQPYGALRFLTNRALRIVPTFLFIAIISISIFSIKNPTGLKSARTLEVIPNISESFVENLKVGLVNLVNVVFEGWPNLRLFIGVPSIPQFWTVGSEEFYYVIALLITVLARGKRSISAFILLSLGVFLAYNSLEGKLCDYQTFLNYWYRNSFSHLLYFSAGFALANIKNVVSLKTSKSFSTSLQFSCLLIIVIGTKYVSLPFSDSVSFLLIEFSCCAIASIYLLVDRDLGKRGKIGALSYPVYVSHYLVIDVFSQDFLNLFQNSNVLFRFLMVSIGSLLISIGILAIIEKPLEKYRDLIRGRTIIGLS